MAQANKTHSINKWLQKSIAIANKTDYLDQLYEIYKLEENARRNIDETKKKLIIDAYNKQDCKELLKILLTLDLFPFKDSYVAYLRRDKTAIDRNPKTTLRLCSKLYEMGLDKIFESATAPKESNRQIGPLFKNWVKNADLGAKVVDIDHFKNYTDNAILDATEKNMTYFAKTHLGYNRDKGLDFLARINGKYVIGEAKFLTDFGGHQNAQFNDAISIFQSVQNINVIPIAILDGVLYIKGENKMYKDIISGKYCEYNIMTALLLKKFLASI